MTSFKGNSSSYYHAFNVIKEQMWDMTTIIGISRQDRNVNIPVSGGVIECTIVSIKTECEQDVERLKLLLVGKLSFSEE